jgi:dCTP deaminase
MKGSVRPTTNESVENLLQKYAVEKIDLSQGAVLHRDDVYIVALQERVNISKHEQLRINAKSTTGRDDLQVRLINDHNSYYDFVPGPYQGKLYTEVAPHSFHSFLKSGTALSQLRYTIGNPVLSDDEIRWALKTYLPLAYHKNGKPVENIDVNGGLVLTLDLQGDREKDSRIVGYRAKKNNTPVLDLQKVAGHKVDEFFETITGPLPQDELILEPGYFYLLGTKEAVSFPHGLAGELAQFDSRIGHITSHYAGFFDPGFGYHPGEKKQGSAVTLEVRVHNKPEIVRHSQPIGILRFERMAQIPQFPYGTDRGSNYSRQTGVRYGKHFYE